LLLLQEPVPEHPLGQLARLVLLVQWDAVAPDVRELGRVGLANLALPPERSEELHDQLVLGEPLGLIESQRPSRPGQLATVEAALVRRGDPSLA
jgi:hypothetical protein